MLSVLLQRFGPAAWSRRSGAERAERLPIRDWVGPSGAQAAHLAGVDRWLICVVVALGFDDAELARLNPRLVHLAISGYGPDGPERDRPGYDFILQAEAGLMSITGFPDADGGEPTKVGEAIADVVTGLFGAVSALAALIGRERTAATTTPRPPPLPSRMVRPRAAVSASTSRCSNPRWRCWSTRPERVRDRAPPGSARQRAPDRRPVRDVPHGGRGSGAGRRQRARVSSAS